MSQRRAKSYKTDYFLWVKDVWTVRGQPLDFDDHKYLVQIYKDQYHDIVIMKSAQSGVSEREISESFWVCDQLGKNVLYVFPAQGQLGDFVTGRVDPVIANSDYLSLRVTGTTTKDLKSDGKKRPDRTGLKRIGEGFLYFRGSQNEKQIISVDADMVVVDERDRFKQTSIPYIDKRLLHSKLKWKRYISTPTIPGKFIHADYMSSDQHTWHIVCGECKTEQVLDWWKNVVEDKNIKDLCRVICWKCKKDIDRLKQGIWKPQNPDSLRRGYHINGLYNPYLDLADAWKQSLAPDIHSVTQFYNQTLGLPYEPEGARITQASLDSCRRAYDIPYRKNDRIVKNCTAGADVGNVIHVIVSKKEGSGDDEKARYVWVGTVNHFFGPQDSLEWVMKTFNVETMVVDILPETRSAQQLAQKFPGRVFGCRYPNKRFSGGYLEWKLDDYEVHVDRTISLDYYVSEIDTQKVIIPDIVESIDGFYDQMKASVRVIDDTKNIVTAVWQETGPDHYFHASNYDRIARQRGGTGQSYLNYYKSGTSEEKTEEETHADLLDKYTSLVESSGKMIQ